MIDNVSQAPDRWGCDTLAIFCSEGYLGGPWMVLPNVFPEQNVQSCPFLSQTVRILGELNITMSTRSSKPGLRKSGYFASKAVRVFKERP